MKVHNDPDLIRLLEDPKRRLDFYAKAWDSGEQTVEIEGMTFTFGGSQPRKPSRLHKLLSGR